MITTLRQHTTRAWLASLSGLLLLAVISWVFVPTSAQHGSVVYWKARVAAVQPAQNTRTVELQSGPRSGSTVTASINPIMNSLDMSSPDYAPGSTVFISHNQDPGGESYFAIVDYYRIPAAVWIVLFVVALAVVFAGWRGFGALAGLAFSVFVISQFLIPNVVAGNAPYLTTAIAIMVISVPGIYVAHGINRRTSLALISCYVTLIIAVAFSAAAVAATRLTGIADEETWLLSQLRPQLDIQGLMLCGLLISLVGILDDVTVAQTVAVHELHTANPKLTIRQLYAAGLRIGREHIASLVNTLVLVYVGASFLFIAYLSVAFPYPLLMIVNSEFVMEELVRALAGSAAVIVAVPITTIIAARYLRTGIRRKDTIKPVI